MKRRKAALACACFAVALLVSLPAAAFCRTTTCDPNDPKQICTGDRRCAVTSGTPLFWKSLCISFNVQKRGSPLRGISLDQAVEVVGDGFVRWLNADCGGANPGFRIADFGPISCDHHEYNPEKEGGNANVWIFRDDDWPHEGGPHTLALTFVTFETQTGEIFDADVEINSFQNELTLDEDNPITDLPSIATHEAGHFLGLSHNVDPELANCTTSSSCPTMFREYPLFSTDFRSLEQDDRDGICAIFPPDRQTPSTSCEPRHGFLSECFEPKEDSGCCRVSPGSGPQGSAAPAALLGLLALMLYRLRRSAKRN